MASGTESIRAFKDRALQKLADEKVDLRVAHLPGEPESIVGFAVVENGTVLFVYVTKDARKMGVARKLTKGTR